MRLKSTAIVGMVAAGALLLAACGSSSSSSGTTTSAAASGSAAAGSAASGSAAAGGGAVSGKVGVILPDTKSSARWETQDRPALEKAFKAAGVEFDIQNANGDKAAMATIADQMITNGVTVLAIVNLDNDSGAAIEKKAASQGVKTIDYDRLTLGGGADYYVSFDNTRSASCRAQGLAEVPGQRRQATIVYLNGSPTDYNATAVRRGRAHGPGPDDQLQEGGRAGRSGLGQPAGRHHLRADVTQPGGKIDGVLAANDGLGNAAIAVLQEEQLEGIPVTGQDATVQGLQNILAGDQCMTVYKAAKKEAARAGQGSPSRWPRARRPTTTGTVKDTQASRTSRGAADPRGDLQGQRQGRRHRRRHHSRRAVHRHLRRRLHELPASADALNSTWARTTRRRPGPERQPGDSTPD